MDEDQENTAAIVDDIKMSLTLLFNILDYNLSNCLDIACKSVENEKVADVIFVANEESTSIVELKDKIKENDILKREILLLKQQLLNKEKKIKKLEFIFGFSV